MTYLQAIKEAKARYAEAMDEVAWDALAISEKHGKPLTTVCKDIAGDGWSALEQASRRRRKAAGQTPDQLRRAREQENRRAQEAHFRAFVKRDPDAAAVMIAKVHPDAVMQAAAEAAGRVRETASGAASTPLLSERWERWFNQLGNLMIEGARLAEETDDGAEVLDGYAPVARLFYDRLRERQFDAEWRRMNESIDAES